MLLKIYIIKYRFKRVMSKTMMAGNASHATAEQRDMIRGSSFLRSTSPGSRAVRMNHPTQLHIQPRGIVTTASAVRIASASSLKPFGDSVKSTEYIKLMIINIATQINAAIAIQKPSAVIREPRTSF